MLPPFTCELKLKMPRLLCINMSIILIFFCIGSLLGWQSEPLFGVSAAGSDTAQHCTVDFFYDLYFVVQRNLYILALMLLGGLTFGMLTVLILTWNSLFLGFHLHSVLMASIPDAICALIYVPAEFVSLCLMASGAEALGISIFRSLFFRQLPQAKDFGLVARYCAASVGVVLGAGLLGLGAFRRSAGV